MYNKITTKGDKNIILQNVSASTITLNIDNDKEIQEFIDNNFKNINNLLNLLQEEIKHTQNEILYKFKEILINSQKEIINRTINQSGNKSLYIENNQGTINID